MKHILLGSMTIFNLKINKFNNYNMFKKHQIIMLPSNKAKLGMIYKNEDKIGIITNDNFVSNYNMADYKNQTSYKICHLHIVSDKGWDFNIGEEVWVITSENLIAKYKGYNGNPNWRVILASTDSELNVPLIHENDLHNYINKLNDEIFMEYENDYKMYPCDSCDYGDYCNGSCVKKVGDKIKVVKNYVSIKPPKDNWNREEIFEFMREWYEMFHENDLGNKNYNETIPFINKWIQDNL